MVIFWKRGVWSEENNWKQCMQELSRKRSEAVEVENVTWWRWWLSGYQLDVPAFPFTSALSTGVSAAFPMKHMLSHTHSGVWFQFTANMVPGDSDNKGIDVLMSDYFSQLTDLQYKSKETYRGLIFCCLLFGLLWCCKMSVLHFYELALLHLTHVHEHVSF